MALIWSEGFRGENALAPFWQKCTRARFEAESENLTISERVAARVRLEEAQQAYELIVNQAESTLSRIDSPRTHAFVVGVGKYADPGINSVTTSVRGAWEFSDWMLSSFSNPERPLASLELFFSAPDSLEPWKPSQRATTTLGIEPESRLHGEPATFLNLKRAFAKWLIRIGGNPENAAFFYFSGHGLWKASCILLPEDSRLPQDGQAADNLIDLQQTVENMFNVRPSVQCFFIDACQEISPSMLESLDARPGSPLRGSTLGAPIPARDARIYLGSCVGKQAYGLPFQTPFFTEQLLRCFDRTAAKWKRDDGSWVVTTESLREALLAASQWRSEIVGKPILFSAESTGTFTADLCSITKQPDVFVKVCCSPAKYMINASLYVLSGLQRIERASPQTREWYVSVNEGACEAGVKVSTNSDPIEVKKTFEAYPPTYPVVLRVP